MDPEGYFCKPGSRKFLRSLDMPVDIRFIASQAQAFNERIDDMLRYTLYVAVSLAVRFKKWPLVREDGLCFFGVYIRVEPVPFEPAAND